MVLTCRRRKLLAAAALVLLTGVLTVMDSQKKARQKRRRRYDKARPIYKNRKQKGFSRTVFIPLKEKDPDQFFHHTRMTIDSFNKLLTLVEPFVKQRTLSDRISAEERLEITLEYLAQGVSVKSLARSHHMSLTMVHTIIHTMCRLLWDVLRDKYLQPPTGNEWLQIAQGFESRWNFPHCIGALDAKHISIQAPAQSESSFCNKEKPSSVVLQACCDAQYRFTLVDVGAYECQSDGGIFRARVFGQPIDAGTLEIPAVAPIRNTQWQMPYVVVANEAFPLETFIMTPYPGRLLSKEKGIFNFRLSRARRCIENAFGVLAARWRCLKNTVVANVNHIDHVVKATVVLHNFCMREAPRIYCPPGYTDIGDEDNGDWRKETDGLESVGRLSSKCVTQETYRLRDMLTRYFVSPEGSVPWQLARIMR